MYFIRNYSPTNSIPPGPTPTSFNRFKYHWLYSLLSLIYGRLGRFTIIFLSLLITAAIDVKRNGQTQFHLDSSAHERYLLVAAFFYRRKGPSCGIPPSIIFPTLSYYNSACLLRHLFPFFTLTLNLILILGVLRR